MLSYPLFKSRLLVHPKLEEQMKPDVHSNNERFSMAFTTAGLLYRQSVTVAELFRKLKNWDLVRDKVYAENILQTRKHSTAKKIFREIASRLKHLTDSQLTLLTDGERHEQIQILWLAVTKRYRFIHDFAVEVMNEKYHRHDLTLNSNDYDIFFHRKEEWHPELQRLAPETRAKARQRVFNMMRDAELLTPRNTVSPALMSPRTVKAVAEDSPRLLAVFPVTGKQLMEMVR
jgi:hypothetical protein